jgi:hypothetical protein
MGESDAMSRSDEPGACCGRLEGATRYSPVAEDEDLEAVLEPLPDVGGERRYRCRVCGRVWREWVQRVYDGDVYLTARLEAARPGPRDRRLNLPVAGMVWGMLFGCVGAFLAMPPLPEHAKRRFMNVLTPVSPEIEVRTSWVVGLTLAGAAIGALVGALLERRRRRS